jgi:hypothetical protein
MSKSIFIVTEGGGWDNPDILIKAFSSREKAKGFVDRVQQLQNAYDDWRRKYHEIGNKIPFDEKLKEEYAKIEHREKVLAQMTTVWVDDINVDGIDIKISQWRGYEIKEVPFDDEDFNANR